jgi:hypothetical protein
VAFYKLSLKSGLLKARFPIRSLDFGLDFFQVIPNEKGNNVINPQQIDTAKRLIQGEFRFYGFHSVSLGNPPNWFLNPFNAQIFQNVDKHWTEIPDFDYKIGDIKNIWESARFDWVPILASAYSQTGDVIYINTLNSWLRDWCSKNSINQGPNWKCGQESGIRVMNLLNAALILKQNKNSSISLLSFVELSLERIFKNIRYAIAQDNNHGTSEAAALYIGGLFLLENGKSIGVKYRALGKKWLLERVNSLVQPDGSFSQHSVNYHRLFLDTMSFVELWRKIFNDKEFGENFNNKIDSAINWLYYFLDNKSGDAPNLGANDGAFLISFGSFEYRDFRPSIQFASILYKNNKPIEPGNWDNVIRMFGINHDNYPHKVIQRTDKILDSSYGILENSNSWALIRLPKFKFRPSHNDVHHVDIWINGKNIICDSGTFSYNPPDAYKELNLKSVKYHNTVYFDQQDQMPKISRFLLGAWPKSIYVPQIERLNGQSTVNTSYKDYYGNTHTRTLTKVSQTEWQIIDRLSGHFKEAVIGFNVAGTVKKFGKKLTLESCTMQLPDGNIHIKDSFISKYYFQLEEIKRVELTVKSPGTYITSIFID